MGVSGLSRSGPIRLLLVLSAGLLAASLLYVLPNYPAELFHRVWILFAVVATGTASYALWSGAGRLFAHFVGDVNDRQVGKARYARLARFVAAGLLAVVALYIGIGTVFNGSREVLAKARYMTSWGAIPMDRGQPARILAGLRAGERVAYQDELSLVFYASRGGLDHGAVYGPAVEDSPLAAIYYRAGGRVTRAVKALENFYGVLQLQSERPVVIRSKRPVDWSRVRINVEARKEPLTLRIRLAGPEPRESTISIPSGAAGWYALGLPKGWRSSAIAIVRGGGQSKGSIRGLRLAPTDRLAWPWDAGIRIMRWRVAASLAQALGGPARPAKSKQKTVYRYRFVSADLAPAGCRNLGVIEDYGATVASRVSCGESNKKAAAAR